MRTPEDVVAFQCAKAVSGVMGAFLEYAQRSGNRSLCAFFDTMPFTANFVNMHPDITSLLFELWTLSDAAFDFTHWSEGSIHVKLQELGVGLDSMVAEAGRGTRAVTTFHPVALHAFAAQAAPNALAPHINSVVGAVKEVFEALGTIPFLVEIDMDTGEKWVGSPSLKEWNTWRGKYLEIFIAVALRIPASIPGKHSDVNSDWRVEDFRVSAPMVLDGFPGGPDRTLSNAKIRRLKSMLKKHFAKSSLAAITMTSSGTNSGCDVALIGNLANGERVLILYEVKCLVTTNSMVHSTDLMAKVELCLQGVARIEKDLNISRVCMVFCAPSCEQVPLKFETSSEQLSQRLGMSAAVTLHMVTSDAAWRRLLLHTFHWLLPIR